MLHTFTIKQAENWQSFKSFAKEFIFTIGGTTMIYLNDFNFQDVEGKLCTGGSFEKAIEDLKKNSRGIEIDELTSNKGNKFEKMNNWFIERIKKETGS